MTGRRVWMDSGAFSAFTLGEQIPLSEYGRWIATHARYIEHYAVLDKIGSAESTWANQLALEAMGIHPVPCYHYGEDPKWLKRYIDAGYQYIAIGGMVPISRVQLRHWLDELWDTHLTNADGAPVVRVHGFGLTTFELMERYPWFSVDSSSWLLKGAMGGVVMWDGERFVSVNVSEESGKTGVKGQHYMSETPANRARIEEMCRARGWDVNELATNHKQRRVAGAQGFLHYAQQKAAKSVPRLPGIFVQPRIHAARPPAPGWPFTSLEMYLAGEVEMVVEKALYDMGANRMFSYHYVGNKRSTKQWRARMAVRDGQPFPDTKEL